MKLALELNAKDLNGLNYPVVVMMWHHAVGRSASGRVRRAFHNEFTPAERRKARTLYNHFYRWYLVTGTPQVFYTTPTRYEFMTRLCNFFGGI